jgi:hypothetical protein
MVTCTSETKCLRACVVKHTQLSCIVSNHTGELVPTFLFAMYRLASIITDSGKTDCEDVTSSVKCP